VEVGIWVLPAGLSLDDLTFGAVTGVPADAVSQSALSTGRVGEPDGSRLPSRRSTSLL